MFRRLAELAREGDAARVASSGVFRRAGRAIAVFVLLFLVVPGAALAQGHLVTEQNIADAILGRREFLPVELNSLDLNRDGVVDVTDLTFFSIRNADLVPSVSFEQSTSKAFEGDKNVAVHLTFTQPFDSTQTLAYSVGGTATYGPKSEGGDYMIAGYNPVAQTGTISVNAGDSDAFILMTVNDDGVFDEGMETVTFLLTGGSPRTYFLGAKQSHVFYIQDNDAIWKAALFMPRGAGYESFDLEITQEEGAFAGRVLADGALIPMPEATDPNRSGDDGWLANIYSGTHTLRIEIGPIPVDPSMSVFGIHRTRYYVIEVGPGLEPYKYDPNRQLRGVVTETLIPVKQRLGSADQTRRFLRRETTGYATLDMLLPDVVIEEVPLQNAK